MNILNNLIAQFGKNSVLPQNGVSGLLQVAFDANDGSAATDINIIQGCALGNLPIPVAHAGYIFKGWWTRPSGGTQISAETIPTDNTIYFAHWVIINDILPGDTPPIVIQHIITLDANGGSVTSATKSIDHNTIIGALPTPVRSGYKFVGWFTAATGGIQVNATTVVNANTTYYAHWTVNKYKVTFHPNGGSVTASSRDVAHGAVVGTLPTPTRAYYKFVGWYTAFTGGAKITSATTITGHTTYYARWQVSSKPKTFAPAAVVDHSDFKKYVKYTAPSKTTIKKKRTRTIKLTLYKNVTVKLTKLDRNGKKIKLKIKKGKNNIKVTAGEKGGTAKITIVLKNGNRKIIKVTVQ